MPVNSTISIEEFEALWANAPPEARFRYAVPRRVWWVYGLPLALFWLLYSIRVMRDGWALDLLLVGGLMVCVTVFTGLTLLYWRRYARVSGVVLSDRGVAWRHFDTCAFVAWNDVQLDETGLLAVDIGTRQLSYSLRLGSQRLWLFRPHVHLVGLERFLGQFLAQMKAHGRIQKRRKRRRTER